MLLQPIPATAWYCANCGTSDPRRASALYHDVCTACEGITTVDPTHISAAVWAARSAALEFTDAQAEAEGAPLTPALFYGLGTKARQATALAGLTAEGRLRFAVACADHLEARYGETVTGITVLEVWYRAGLLGGA
ncbi:MAG: hypothetical protein WCG26_00960 [Chloroflexales bacterium]